MLNPTPAGLAALMITKDQDMPNRVLAMLGASHTGPTAMVNVLSLKRQVDRIEELETQVKVLSGPKPAPATPAPAPTPTTPEDPVAKRLEALEKQVTELQAERDALKKRVEDLEKKLAKNPPA